MLNTSINMMVIGSESLGMTDYEGGTLMNKINVLIKEAPESSFFTYII